MNGKLQTALTVLCGLALALSFFGLHPALPFVAVAAGLPFALKAGLESLASRTLDVNVLMILAGAGAIALGHPGEAAVLLFLFSLSSTLESYALSRTRSAIEGLVRLQPDTAEIVLPEGSKVVRVTEVQVGDLVRVKPFEQVPLDGLVESGATHVDQSAMTGESQPVGKQAGEKVLAGTQNLEGTITLRVQSVAGDSTLEKIVSLVQDAQNNKASGERISQWFGQRYTLFVIAAAVLSVSIRFALGEGADRALYASLTLLVALSPCALVISTPATTLSALAWAARKGMLVRGGEFIELAGQANVLALDKTGTLTEGRPVLDEICVCGPVAAGQSGAACLDDHACWSGGAVMSDEAKRVLRLAAAAEQYSTHPLASAIVQAARDQGLDVPECGDQQVVPGMGVIATVDGQQIKIGQQRFFTDLAPEFLVHAREIQAQGMTVVLLQVRDTIAALGLRDRPRPEAKSVMRVMDQLGLDRRLMLTGDNPETARAIAAELELSEVHAGLLPADKEKLIADLADSGANVMFVGDGVNDAPSLARANVGVAMGGLGSDVALNAADVVLVHDNLARLVDLVQLGRKTNRTVRANLFFAAGVVVTLTVGTIVFDAFFPAQRYAVLPYAVVGHEGSTFLVILNGLRLLNGPSKTPLQT